MARAEGMLPAQKGWLGWWRYEKRTGLLSNHLHCPTRSCHRPFGSGLPFPLNFGAPPLLAIVAHPFINGVMEIDTHSLGQRRRDVASAEGMVRLWPA